MIWSLIQNVGGQAVTLTFYVLLAVALTPVEFGIVGLATVWTAVLSAFTELGFGAALVQRREITSEHTSTTFVVNLAVGVLLGGVGALVAGPVATWFDEPLLRPVVTALSLGFVLRAPGLTHAALALRDMRFRTLAMRDIVANGLGGAVGLSLAIAGFGVWSLVALNLVVAASATAIMWLGDSWRPRFGDVSKRALAELWPYSSSILGFNLFKAVAQNADRLIVGQLLGTAAVGFYSVASRLVLQAIAVPINALGVYLFPKVSRADGDLVAARESYGVVLALSLAIAVPFVVAVLAAAPALVPWLGEAWLPVVPLMAWLGLAAVARAIFSPGTQMMKALGRPDTMLRWSIVVSVITTSALFAGASWGLTGVTAAFAIGHLVALPMLIRMVYQLSGYGFREHLRRGRRALTGGVLMSAGLYATNAWLSETSVAALGIVSAGAWGVWLLRREPEVAARAPHSLRWLVG
ncbi:MAG: lipopolysaccharide biosynthesis protein [Longimicrobiales bacterium]